MNLKESFRYQTFLDNILSRACTEIKRPSAALTVTKTHLCSAANPDAADYVEVVETAGEVFKCDDVIDLTLFLIEEKEKITTAISKAKSQSDIDIDMAVVTNKYRQQLYESIKYMLSMKTSTTMSDESGYKFNVEGNQVNYWYKVKTDCKEAYDRERSKDIMREVIHESDEISSKIDAMRVNVVVDYEPPFNVNDSFEDVMNKFLDR